jgi:DNA-binding transcriptional MerR regulator/methylmalonyl-CoA mutase cobalamin-binding subunit
MPDVTNTAEPAQIPRYPVRLVAVRTGLSPHVLRAWERRYGVVSPTRTEGGQRLYSDHDIERLLRLRRLTDQGHAIGRIASLPLVELASMEEEAQRDERPPPPPLEERSLDADTDRLRADDVRESIVAALEATRRLDAVELQAVLERAAVTLGVPVFIDEVVAPTLGHIGHGWSEGTVSVGQEHMATAVFRRVLGWLLRVYEVRGIAPRLVVTTPPGQVHELGALMAAASAAAEGWSVTYLGADLPIADLVDAARQANARAVAISAVYVPEGGDLIATVREIRAGLPERVLLAIGGAAAAEISAGEGVEGALVLASLPEFRALLRRMAEEDSE